MAAAALLGRAAVARAGAVAAGAGTRAASVHLGGSGAAARAAAPASHRALSTRPVARSLLGRACAWGARGVAVGVGASAVAAAGLYATDRPMCHALVRVGRCVLTAGSIVADYRALPPRGSAGADAAMRAAHERGGRALLALCEANGGIYVKIGQHIALLDYLVPDGYVVALRPLFDRNRTTPFADVRAAIEQDLGDSLENLFASFEEKPIASASLAQVHVATDARGGGRLAVKVQHPDLLAMARTEVWLLARLVDLVRLAVPGFGFQWLVEEVSENLPRELDFTVEADNAARCIASLRGRFPPERVVVPAVHRALSSRRVLTMQFEPGVQVSDLAGLRAARVDARETARLLTRVFAHMTFRTGFVHCDPHPGNVLVRRAADGGPQIILLDHGLYRQVESPVRVRYAQLWAAIVAADEEEMREACAALGARSARIEALRSGHSFTLLAAMLTARPYSQIRTGQLEGLDVRTALAHDAKARDALRADVARYAAAIVEVLESLPRSVLLLLKTNDALRSVGARLGARPADTFVVQALEALGALAEAPELEAPQPQQRHAPGALARRGGPRWRRRLKLARARARLTLYSLFDALVGMLAGARARLRWRGAAKGAAAAGDGARPPLLFRSTGLHE